MWLLPQAFYYNTFTGGISQLGSNFEVTFSLPIFCSWILIKYLILCLIDSYYWSWSFGHPGKLTMMVSFISNLLLLASYSWWSLYSEWSPVISGVPQGSVLGLLILYVDDLCSVINHSSIKFFADDVTIFKKINNRDDCSDLQKDLDVIIILDWSSKWLPCLNPVMHILYQLNDYLIIWPPANRYLSAYISSSLRWIDHCSYIAKRASNTLNYIHQAMFTCLSKARSLAFKCLVRPQLEYSCHVWNPQLIKDIQMPGSVPRVFRWSGWINIYFQDQFYVNGTMKLYN